MYPYILILVGTYVFDSYKYIYCVSRECNVFPVYSVTHLDFELGYEANTLLLTKMQYGEHITFTRHTVDVFVMI
jgi:hypothetical protein